MKILLGGALGRMGQEVTAAAAEAQVEIVCGVDVAYTGQPSDYPIVTAFDQATQKAGDLIYFSRPSALPELLQLVRKEKMPAVLCTTGYNEAELQMIEEASREIPVFRSANMSLGVNVLRHLVQEAARALGEDFDVEIVERHHRMKADSPSGTALMLYDSVKEATEPLRQPVSGTAFESFHTKDKRFARHRISLNASRQRAQLLRTDGNDDKLRRFQSSAQITGQANTLRELQVAVAACFPQRRKAAGALAPPKRHVIFCAVVPR